MKTRIVVLAAGYGSRMKAEVPKPLVEIAGKPMITHLLSSIKESGLDEKPILVVSPDGIDLFKAVCGDQCAYAIQDKQLGTGHAAACAESELGDATAVLVLYGDHPFISADIMKQIAAKHEEEGATITMLTCTVPNFEGDYSGLKGWSRIVRDSEGALVKDVQVKDASKEELLIKELNPCIFIFDRAWMFEQIPQIRNNNAQEEYYLTDLLKMAVDQGKKIATIEADALEVIGVNSKEELRKAEELLEKSQ